MPDTPPNVPPVETPTDAAPDATEAQNLSALLQAVRAPISEANPVGEDVKYEDSFQQLKAEVDKLQSASADADFERIVELGQKVLTEQSKDLTAAAFLGIGLVRTAGTTGVAESVEVARLLCETYWDDLYPPPRRMAARKNALQLLIDRSHEWLEGQKPKRGDEEALARARDSYKTLQALVMERMDEHAPVVSKMTKLLEAKLRAVPKAPSSKPTAPSGDGAAAPTAAPSAPSELSSPAGAADAITAAAAFLHDHDKTDPAPFRLARALHWGGLLAAPPAEQGRTRIPPFVEQRKDYLDGLLSRAQFADLASEAEETFREQPFWLDLQRYVVTALDALGTPLTPARDGVVEDVVGLVRRFPSLPSLTFDDGTPFADAATQEWIETRIRPALGGGEPAEPVLATDGEASAVDNAYAEARTHLASGDLDAALALLGEGTDAAGRDRFRRRFYLASLCLRGGRPAVARPILEALDAEIAAHRLDVWDPALALEVWTALHGCYAALQRATSAADKPALQEAAERIFAKVCAADPARALAVQSAKQG
ncbi:MAG: type VI secretion system protein TssA [Bacteroidota bacterium]